MTREQFLAAAALSASDDCVLWPFAVRKSSGYGAHNLPTGKRNRKVNIDAHVRACILAHGDRPGQQSEVAHSCGQKLCCNGRHLRWSTRWENMQDAKAHGTLRGGGRYRQRLGPEDVASIQASSESLTVWSKRYGMAPSYMGVVRRAGRLAHV